MRSLDKRLVVGWIAVVLSVAITCFWAFWGAAENFHEGWFHESLLQNLGLMLGQYLSPMLAFLLVTLVSIYWPRVGGGLHVAFALFAAWFFDVFDNTAMLLLIAPLVVLGALYWYGRPAPRRRAAYLAAGLPLLTMILVGLEPAYRVSQRMDDGNRQARLVEGNGVALTWAPEGPGWPTSGTDWQGAIDACRHLDEGGLATADVPQDVWRLPTVDESVRSMARHGLNSVGTWDPDNAEATYETRPDKESPLWSTRSQVIYWWTSSESDTEHAYIIVYDGKVWPRSKDFGPAYLGYRCVRP